MFTADDRQIAIIGGGIAGLTTAIALQQLNYQPVVYERSTELREVGAGITLWHNAMAVLDQLGVAEEIYRQGREISSGSIFTSSGDLLNDMDFTSFDQIYGVKSVAIHRAKLLRILADQVGDDHIKLSKELVTFEQNPLKIVFTDTSITQPDVMIGADGIFSDVRAKMKPDIKPQYSGYIAYRSIVEIDPDEMDKLQQYIGEYWGRGLRFGSVAISDTELYWFATENLPEHTDLSDLHVKSRLLQHFGDWTKFVVDLIEQTEEENILVNKIYDLKPFQSWYDGRCLLIGDAAHATTPNLGQGAAISIEDAYVIATLMPGQSTYNVFEAFEQLRYHRTKWICKTSRRLGSIGNSGNPAVCVLRNLGTRLFPWYIKYQIKKAISFDFIQNRQY